VRPEQALVGLAPAHYGPLLSRQEGYLCILAGYFG
jgi:hypothetical protein